MKLKIPKIFNMNEFLRKAELNAKHFMWVFGMLLATVTVVNILPILTEINRLILMVLLILFFFAGLIVFISDLQGSKQKGTEIPAHIERAGRNRWISIGAVVFVAIVIGLIFVARQLPPTPQGYQAFFTAFAGIAALGIGIALGVFAYQQYKLRQIEHSLLFNPQILLSGSSPKIGPGVYNNQKYTYRIEWSVFILNLSQIPILIRYMQVRVKLAGEDSSREGLISPTHCHVVEPENLSEQFEVTLTKPCYITWIVEGPSAGDVFDYVSGDSGKRDFVLVFRVIAKRPQDPEESIFPRETVSCPIYVPKDAKWDTPTPFNV